MPLASEGKGLKPRPEVLCGGRGERPGHEPGETELGAPGLPQGRLGLGTAALP